MTKYILLAFFLLFFANSCKHYNKKEKPIIAKGFIDLQNWDFENQGNIILAGEWEFYFTKIYKEIKNNQPNYINAPSEWNKFDYKGQGFGVYKIKILLPQNKDNLILKISRQSTALNVYLNGKLSDSVGEFGINTNVSVPDYKICFLQVPNDKDTLELAIEVSNFDYFKGGLWEKIYIGCEQKIEKTDKNLFSFDLFLFTALIVLSLYHLGLLLSRAKFRSALFFAMLCFIGALRVTVTGQMLIRYFFPEISWVTLVKLEFISFYLILTFSSIFLRSVLPDYISKIICRFNVFIGLLLSLFTIFTPILINSYLITPYKYFVIINIFYFIYCIIRALINKKSIAKWVAIGLFIMVLAYVNDFLYSQSLIKTLYLVPIGIFAFSFTQAVGLSRHLAKAFNEVENLSNILKETNQNLENTVKERVKEIEKLSLIASQTDNAIMILDKNGNIEWINPGFTKMYGFTFEEFIKRGSNIFSSSTNIEVIKPIKYAIEHKQTLSYEAQLTHKNGNKIWIHTTWTPVLNNTGEIDKLIAIDSDVSKQKEAENQIYIQKEELTTKNKELNDILKIINEQKKEIENTHKKTTYSISYAKNIQKAIFPTHQYINQLFAENFILFKPRDIVSGDFYYFKQIGNHIYIAVADCTGHGVPGALMSMLGIALLNEIISKEKIISANIILEQLRILLKNSLHQQGLFYEQQDGMDISFGILNNETKELSFSGAHQSLIIFRDNNNSNKKLLTFHADKQPVGVYLLEKPFTEHKILLQKNDILYFYTDGYASQFGGETHETFKLSRLKNILNSIGNENLTEQKQILIDTITNWKTTKQQTDDVLILGLKI